MKRFGNIRQLFVYRYFGRVFYLSIFSLLILVAIVSSMFYFYFEDTITKNKYEADMQMLEQIKSELENTNRFITNFCSSVYFNSAATEIMRNYHDGVTWGSLLDNIKSVSSSMVSFAPYIHSVYIYNNWNDTWYSTYTGLGTVVEDKNLNQMIERYARVPVLMPLARKIKAKDLHREDYKDVFSYFFYEAIDKRGRFDGAVVVNVDPVWLMDSLSRHTLSNNAQFFLMTADREFINIPSGVPDEYIARLNEIYFVGIDQDLKRGVQANMLPCEILGEKYMLSYSYLGAEDFILIKTESFSSVYAGVRQIRNALLVIVIIVILIALLMSLIMSDTIYKPIRNLVKNLAPQQPGEGTRGRLDELGFLEDAYTKNLTELSALRREVNSAGDVKYNYYLIQILLNSSAVSSQELEAIQRSRLFNIDINSPMMLMLLKLDDRLAAESSISVANMDAELKRALSDSISKYCVSDVINLQNGYIVALVNVGAKLPADRLKRLLCKEAQTFQRKTSQLLGFSFAAVISDLVTDKRKISETFLALQRNLEYRYILGGDAVITTDMIAKNLSGAHTEYPAQKEKRLIREIKAQNFAAAEAVLDDILKAVVEMSYSDIVTSAFRLCNVVRDTAEEIAHANLRNSCADTIGSNPMEYATIFELRESLVDFIKNGAVAEHVSGKHQKLVDAAKELICNQYWDPALCLISIADALKISPNYLNQIFKGVCGSSVSNFITDYRLEKAASLLTDSGGSVITIMGKVGIENESFFYKRFKAKFGATPKNYLAAQCCDQASDGHLIRTGIH